LRYVNLEIHVVNDGPNVLKGNASKVQYGAVRS